MAAPDLYDLTSPRLNGYIAQEPTPHQAAFLWTLEHTREVLYGGAARGGKSTALLMGSLQYIDIPGQASVIIRKNSADLFKPGGLIQRSHEWLGGTDAHWNGIRSTWNFPNGSKLLFGHCASEIDRFNYDSAEFQFAGFEEGTELTEKPYLHIGFIRVTRPDSGPLSTVPLRTAVATNPGRVGHDFFKDRFQIPDPGKTSKPTPGRAYIRAKLWDNPFVDRASYAEGLEQVDPITQARYLEGDWSVAESGDFFRREWFKIVPKVPAGQGTRVRYWDFASTKPHPGNTDPDWTEGAKLTMRGPDAYLEHYVSMREEPAAVRQAVLQTAVSDGKDTRVWWEEEGGSSGKGETVTLQRLLRGFVCQGDRVTGPKTARAVSMAHAAHQGHFHLVAGPWNEGFLDQAVAFGSGAGHDDKIDAASGAFRKASSGWGWGDLRRPAA